MGTIQNQVTKTNTAAPAAQQTVNQMMSSILDGEKMRGRFDELLGKRAPQFISSLVSLVNADQNMQMAFYESPMTVVQAGLKAATFDLPVDQNLGYAYIVPFKNKGKMTANFILGWKGMHQLALRTGSYKTINVVDIREGELKSYNRLTEEVDIRFEEDEDKRETLPIIGYVGYYRLVNGAEKTIYMTVKQIENHEKRFRKGAKWIMSNDTLTAIELLKDGNDRLLFHDDMSGEYDGILLGYPVEVSDNMPEIATGKTVIYFGDYSGLALKQRDDALQLRVLREKFADQHAIGVVAWLEFDAKVENAQKIAKLTMA